MIETNERDQHPMLRPVSREAEHSWETARDKWEEGVGDGRSVYSRERQEKNSIAN